MYSYHNKLYQHKSYLVIKQVEQCAKRLHKMQLKHSVQSLINSCSRVTRKRKLEIGSPKQVPNQPILEWILLKVMGGSKLILRLMDMCCKAFLLTAQFLRCGTYVLLNVIMMGILSRLWVLFKRILIYLEVLYDKLLVAINEVSKFQCLPFVKDFSFPVSIRQWLDLPSFKRIQIKLPSLLSRMTGVTFGKPSVLDKLFLEPKTLSLVDDVGVSLDGNKMNYDNAPKFTNQFLDIGVPVQDQRLCKIGSDRLFGFKMKLLQAQSHNFSMEKQKSEGEFSCKRMKCEQPLVQLDEFLKRITAAQSLSVLARELKTIFHWFRQRNLKHESCYLGNRFLRCHKLKMVESLGYCFPEKINFIKTSVCKYLTKRSRRTFQQDKIFKNHLSGTTPQKSKIRRLKLCKIQSRRKKSLLKVKHLRIRLAAKKRNRRLHTIHCFDFDRQAFVKRQNITRDKYTEHIGNIDLNQNLNNVAYLPRLRSPVVPNADDIDHIFSEIGV
ncbi:nucleolus and neural progenitor protein isoform X2 [Narcine bancroftii]